MGKPFRELIKDVERDSASWEVVKVQVDSSTNRSNKGGTSLQELLRHKTTGEELVRHTLIRPDGRLFAKPHFRRHWT